MVALHLVNVEDMLAIIIAGRRKGNKGSALSAGAKVQTSAMPAHHETGTVTLKPRKSPLTNLILVTLFALFWNGIVSVFVAALFSDFQIVLALFLTPFVLVGLGLIGAVVYTFLALFNPRIEVRVDPGAMPLGSTVALEWNVLGNTARIARFRIWLIGKESATYRRGTDTVTDDSTFEKIPILEATNPADMRMGAVQFAVPEFTVPTFEADNNKIQWYIKVHGDIHRWPDIDEEYEVTVLPLPVAGN